MATAIMNLQGRSDDLQSNLLDRATAPDHRRARRDGYHEALQLRLPRSYDWGHLSRPLIPDNVSR